MDHYPPTLAKTRPGLLLLRSVDISLHLSYKVFDHDQVLQTCYSRSFKTTLVITIHTS